MARYIGQIKGEFSPHYDVVTEIPNIVLGENSIYSMKNIKIVKVGIQCDQDVRIEINDKRDFRIGKIGYIEYDNVNITKLKFSREYSDEYIPVVVDFVCDAIVSE